MELVKSEKVGAEVSIVVPDTLDECESRLRSLEHLGFRASLSVWIIVYQAKEILGRINHVWMEWVKKNMILYKNNSHLYAMYNVGELLVEYLHQPEFEILQQTPFDHLNALARLERHMPGSLPVFLEKHDVLELSRDEVVKLVNEERGITRDKKKPVKKGKEPVFPDEVMVEIAFAQAVKGLVVWDNAKLEEFALKDHSVNPQLILDAGLRLVWLAGRKQELGEMKMTEAERRRTEQLLEDILGSYRVLPNIIASAG